MRCGKKETKEMMVWLARLMGFKMDGEIRVEKRLIIDGDNYYFKSASCHGLWFAGLVSVILNRNVPESGMVMI